MELLKTIYKYILSFFSKLNHNPEKNTDNKIKNIKIIVPPRKKYFYYSDDGDSEEWIELNPI